MYNAIVMNKGGLERSENTVENTAIETPYTSILGIKIPLNTMYSFNSAGSSFTA